MGHGWVTAPVGSQKTKASEFTYGLDEEKEKKEIAKVCFTVWTVNKWKNTLILNTQADTITFVYEAQLSSTE